ncbi:MULTISPECIES: Na(+)-translocating NADH-quinone reductase subunit C [unclassified Hahella]|uniref:Na(+)-translocating NADH-quinone reductase subunit C n=1 Tax=unclassified Hahella TaxID=2624107 RepID=UPI000FDE3CBA|nr:MULTISPECIES: Na(+)-translocating NADH-quinone reductase subunit C [unclassified Hahella]AZZ93030.1 Na(+)-translocating NADH-quinone reductase subunit C [Hahella sp. KA22]MBU6950564.1 Na(+)-translocating NADH-quinone reductase subunit C [Hahella sp. HN01]MDG9667895.1 Na(+)-translocating NADH-quinone reductase subunit C [Hahella sp. CR1]QAY56404.1 Na(+)-translocating NADH-quinone reductase subunit C [Hahella sp. KA22]
MSKSNDSIQKTVIVALALCIVCSIFVSASVVLLKPVQIQNKTLNLKENILRAAGMLSATPTKKEVEEKFAQITPKIVDLDTGLYVEPKDIGFESVDAFDQKKSAQNPKLSKVLDSSEDLASIKRRERYAKVYLVKENGALTRVILPVKGYGLWSTLYGFLALKADGDSVVGLGFYEHGETPGLGGEVDNPNWKAQWPGKEVYDDNFDVAVRLVKGGVNPSSSDAKYSVDALSGASLTSRGVENLLHYWLSESGFKTYLEKVRSGEAGNV